MNPANRGFACRMTRERQCCRSHNPIPNKEFSHGSGEEIRFSNGPAHRWQGTRRDDPGSGSRAQEGQDDGEATAGRGTGMQLITGKLSDDSWDGTLNPTL